MGFLQTVGRLAPTVGGVLGGIGGELVDPLGGGIVGAGLGSGAGKALENYTQGQNPLQMNDVGAAAEGAAGQGAGELAGAGLGLLGGAFGKAADAGASGLLKGQFANGSLDGDTLNTLRDMGVTDARDVTPIADAATGENGAINQGVMRGLDDGATLSDLSHIQPTAQALVDQERVNLQPNSEQDIMSTVENGFRSNLPKDQQVLSAKRLSSGGYGNAPKSVLSFMPGAQQNMTAQDALKMSKQFDQLANVAGKAGYDNGGRIANADQAAKYRIFSQLSGNIKDSFADTPIDEDNKAQIIDDLAKIKGSNPQAYNYLVNKVSGANTVGDLRTVQKPLVRASQAFKQTANSAERAPGMAAKDVTGAVLTGAGTVAGGPAGAVPGLLTMAANHPAAERIGSSVLERMGNILQNPTLSKALKGATGALGTTVATSPNVAAPAQGGAMQPPGMGMQPGQPGMQQTGMPPVLNSYDTLMTMMTMDPYLAQSLAPQITALAPMAQKTAGAEAMLPSVEQSYQQAGGGQGPIMGTLAKLGGALGVGPAATYNNQSQALQALLGQIGLPSSYVPSLTQAPQSGALGFNALNSSLNSAPLLAGVR